MSKVAKVDQVSIRNAAMIIQSGGLVAFPTDTVYGLGCDPFSARAVTRLVKAKRRVRGALPVLVDTLDNAVRIGQFDEEALKLAQRFWPGPLTIVVKCKASFPAQVIGLENTIGLRIPARRETIELIERSGGAIIGTSANISGQPSPKTADQVRETMGSELDMILDGGPAVHGTESSVVKVEGRLVSVLREGVIARQTLIDSLKK